MFLDIRWCLNGLPLKEEIDSLVAICIGTKSLTSDEINTLKQIYSVHYYNVQDGLPIHGMEQRTKEFEDAKNQLSSIAASLKDVISKIQKEAQKSKCWCLKSNQ